MRIITFALATLLTIAAQTKAPESISTSAAERHLDVAAVATNDVSSMAISPDGKTLASSGLFDGRIRLWLKDLSSGEQRPLPGTEGATFPFWSPDSRSIGFFADSKIKRLDLDSGRIRTLLENVNWGAGATWNRHGVILFASYGRYMIHKIPDTGGPQQPITRVDGFRQLVHLRPQFLPDGQHFIFYVQGVPSDRGVYLGQLGDPDGKRLVDSDAAGAYVSGRILFLKDGTLFAQKFDSVQLTLSGTPVALAENVPISGRSVAAFSATGDHVIFRTGTRGSRQQLTWFDRTGNRLGTVGEPFLAGAGAPSFSPDGKTVVVNRLVDGVGDIWTVDVSSGQFKQVTTDPANDSYPAWSADGHRILFSSGRTGTGEMYVKPFGIQAVETLVFPTVGLRHPMDSSRDGKYILYRMNSPDLWALRVDGLQEILISAADPKNEVRWPQFSPDGRWIAFQSTASGRNEIYIRGPFEPPSLGQMSLPLSASGGAWVRWRADGKELFYSAFDGTLMAIPISIDADSKSFKAGIPTPLFTPPMLAEPNSGGLAQQYMVSGNGDRFLVVAAPFEESPVHAILNWSPDKAP